MRGILERSILDAGTSGRASSQVFVVQLLQLLSLPPRQKAVRCELSLDGIEEITFPSAYVSCAWRGTVRSFLRAEPVPEIMLVPQCALIRFLLSRTF